MQGARGAGGTFGQAHEVEKRLQWEDALAARPSRRGRFGARGKKIVEARRRREVEEE